MTLSAISLVSRRFHALVTTPHAWRAAFAQYFPGSTLLEGRKEHIDPDVVPSEKRFFTRLTALASWRSEYILRTKLLHAMERGKPTQPADEQRAAAGTAQTTYNSNLLATVTHLDASWDSGPLGKGTPRFIHGADDEGAASVSDPTKSAPGTWGFGDVRIFRCFAEEAPGIASHGLGAGDVIGVPNAMDVSQKHGMIYAEGLPGGSVFYRSSEEKRGRFLLPLQVHSSPERGIPNLDASRETPCCVWIARSANLPTLSKGLVGLMSGSSYGIVTAYSLGTSGLQERRLERGEVTARWVLSPGVPIVAICVDEDYSPRRAYSGRIWAVALNALGEMFYIKQMPVRPEVPPATKLTEKHMDELAWETGRTVCWSLTEPTKRVAQPDPHQMSNIDGAYTPCGSWNGLSLSSEQIAEETKEIQVFSAQPPKHFRQICTRWDMQRRLEVDFANDNVDGGGEALFIVDHEVEEDETPNIWRFTRVKSGKMALDQNRGIVPSSSRRFSGDHGFPVFGPLDVDTEEGGNGGTDAWLASLFVTKDTKSSYFTATALDQSKYARLTTSEDPLLSMSASANSSPLSTPSGDMPPLSSRTEIPGQRSRFLAAGTSLGAIVVWDTRAPTSANVETVNIVHPLATIVTDSPQISCLGLTALLLVHGGTDGLVQAWDPLRATTRPLRTLNSRFSSRARRRLVQAAQHPRGVGINLFAAGAIALDPDPTTLRGIVSLGAHLRYWSFGSQGTDAYRRQKRRARGAARGSNVGPDHYTAKGRSALLDQIVDEQREYRQDEKEARQERNRLQNRFGVGLLGHGATDEEMLAYATMLSQEAARTDEVRRSSCAASASGSTPRDASSSPLAHVALPAAVAAGGDYDAEMAEAIRLSLEESSTAEMSSPSEERLSFTDEADDLEFVTRLSLAEEESRLEASVSPASSPPSTRRAMRGD